MSAHEQLARMITGYWISQSIYAAAKLGIADQLDQGPRHVDELARATGSHAESLYRLLRALASIGLFTETEPQTFAMTELAEPLREGVPGSQRALALMTGGQQFNAWGEILHSLQTGKPAFEKVYGKPLFEFLGERPDNARIFDDAMTGIHGRESQAVLDAYDFSNFGVVADIGGGNGSNLTAILERNPGMKGILFDLPHVVARTEPLMVQRGLSDRCQFSGGSFFESVPSGADAYLLRHIIHDWYDDQSLAILRNCHRAMPASAKLLVIESVIPAGNAPFAGKFLDLAMLVIPGGKERTAEEYRTLFASAGFDLTRIVPTSLEVSVVEGVKRA